MPSDRRSFLKLIGTTVAAVQATSTAPSATLHDTAPTATPAPVEFPRAFTGRKLSMVAFPLGGVAAGSISLGGRGQLRDWEIFNKPDKGRTLSYAFPSIFVDDGRRRAARVLEARHLPPFHGQDGLGARNVPGLTRLARARFIGEYPLARIEFEDPELPVRLTLEAFSPLIPHDEDDSGLPATILRYRVRNEGRRSSTVSIAWSIENPVVPEQSNRHVEEERSNEFRTSGRLAGLFMSNSAVGADDAMWGSFVMGLLNAGDGDLSHLRGWPKGRWWDAALLFWDDFSSDGRLGPEAPSRNAVGALCLSRIIAPGVERDYTFLLAWHFPNRTPARCGWEAPKGEENSIIGNWYATRFADAWATAQFVAENLERLERKTRQFAAGLRESTLPAAVKDAASANLSTLATNVCFRTADGRFWGFEGANDKRGCCHGNCTHVWNYETVTPHLFPAFARSLREAAFGYSMDEQGAIHFRTALPEGKVRSGFAAADGQMGQIVHAYLDWKLSGDRAWLERMWPRVRKALEFSWIEGGWDADRDGVLEGVQHNTYDVEFYGPNPQCGVYYLAALRACEEMASAMGEDKAAREYRQLFERGSRWLDANLFNGEYYVQKVRGVKKEQIAAVLRSQMGSEDTETPNYQVGEGCLVDQLVGQYLADAAGLGPLVDPARIRKTLESIHRYNFRRDLFHHDSVQRTYVVNDEAALVICDYGKAARPRIPFPYYAEAWTGHEYTVASQMIYAGLVQEGVECFENVRKRFDGERRNPWDEPECGHHYARAMAAWSGVLALGGFRYDGAKQAVNLSPPIAGAVFRCFWSTATGWGVFSRRQSAGKTVFRIRVDHGSLPVRSFGLKAQGTKARATLGKAALRHTLEAGTGAIIRLEQPLTVDDGQELVLEVLA
ncbi:MAG TPA: GH116 family glycosyl-hydrolase [Candidatus Dormibacteraeota bacterium]|nr:GH116 family glycosyl-hydrolase [Candidatus Dormibacteraeota bacterium]